MQSQEFSLGPTIGLNNAWIEDAPGETTGLLGLNAGLTLVYSTEEHWGIGMDLKYSGEGVTTESTLIGDRRRQAAQRAAALRRHPTGRSSTPRAVQPPPTTFYVIALIVAVFVMLGLVMVLSASSITQFHKGNSPWRLFNRQAVWAICGAVALWTCAKVPYQFWQKLIRPGLGVAVILMLLPFVPGIGSEVNDR